MRLYKVLDNRKSCHGGSYTWTPGEWVKVKGELIPCQNGIHLCRDNDLVEWLGPQIWAAETRGELIEAGDKVVVREARITTLYDNWNDRTSRLFACDCAERVLHLCADDRSREAVAVARRYAVGEATYEELAAARAAAGTGTAARVAARSAAWDAAWDAAWYTTWAAARDAERQWQTERLMQILHG